MSIIRITEGENITNIEGNWTVFTDTFEASAGEFSHFTAKDETVLGNPKKDESKQTQYFKEAWWSSDKEGTKRITEAHIGDVVYFNIRTQNIPDIDDIGNPSEISVQLLDDDGGWGNPADPINVREVSKDPITGLDILGDLVTSKVVSGNKVSYSLTLSEGLIGFIEDDYGDEIELYLECGYKEEQNIKLPAFEFNYLKVFEKEVLITVIVELPHSKYSIFKKGQFFSALGLAGHSAMAIGDRYFDYGPDYFTPNIDEKEYDYDFNDDGDKNDNLNIKREKIYNQQGHEIGEKGVLYDDKGVKITDLDHTFAPGRPWWGEMIAQDKGITAHQVKLQDVLDFISLDWRLTNIYGEVNKIEFYAKQSEADRMLNWWLNRYKNLKAYSTMPWTGEQCTTAVKTAIQEGYPFHLGKVINRISDDTQRPSGLLSELSKFISSSKQNFGKPSKITVIKKESTNFKP